MVRSARSQGTSLRAPTMTAFCTNTSAHGTGWILLNASQRSSLESQIFCLFFCLFVFFNIMTNFFPPLVCGCSSDSLRPHSYSGVEEPAATEDLTKGAEMAAAPSIDNSTSDSQAQKIPLVILSSLTRHEALYFKYFFFFFQVTFQNYGYR